MTWLPGDVVVRREVWQGRPWLANPLYVVEDVDDVLVLYQPEGSPWGFGAGDDWPTPSGRHPYAGRTAWEGAGPLGLHRAGDPFAVWAYCSGPERSFLGWYVNIQAPFRRTAVGIDSLDLELDLLVSPALEVFLKDEAQVDASAILGRFSGETSAAIHRLGEELKGRIASGDRWWDDAWRDWAPTPDLLVAPTLEPGWESVPAADRRDLDLLRP
ncbi:MAG: DUF402 domain-containing protein [Acidimicrobiales bacterium]